MRVKIGSKWFDCMNGQPIMIELSEKDRANIAAMHPDATRYALFDDNELMSVEQRFDWMDEGRQS
jgi:hypothetical protein